MADSGTVNSNASKRQRRKGPRPKHQPQRTCIVCRDKTPKRALIRIVRTPDGEVHVDPTGRANGRGAYLCGNPDCWNRALRSGVLSRALRTELDEASLARLRENAENLDDEAAAMPAQAEGE
jgi:uncharacterized protein